MTDIHCEHVLDYVANATIGRDMYTARCKEGIYMKTGGRFDLSTSNGDTTRTATPLLVKASGASGANEINAGIFTLDQLLSKIASWIASERGAGRVHGSHDLRLGHDYLNGQRRMVWKATMTLAGDIGGVNFNPPDDVRHFLGDLGTAGIGWAIESSGTHQFKSAKPPLRSAINPLQQIELIEENGTFADNYPWLPTIKNRMNAAFITSDVGIFLIGATKVIAHKSGQTLRYVAPIEPVDEAADPTEWEITIDDPRGPIEVKQIFYIEATVGNFLKKLFYSTATPTPAPLPTAASNASETIAEYMRELGPDRFAEVLRRLPRDQQLAFFRAQEIGRCQRTRRYPVPEIVETDAGRGDSTRADCAMRACSIALGIPYAAMCAEFDALWTEPAGLPGTPPEITASIMKQYGWQRLATPWHNGRHYHLEDLPKRGRVVAILPGHVACLIDGRVHGMAGDPLHPQCVIAAFVPPDAPTMKPGRNEPCLCGSGQKYKRCCG